MQRVTSRSEGNTYLPSFPYTNNPSKTEASYECWCWFLIWLHWGNTNKWDNLYSYAYLFSKKIAMCVNTLSGKDPPWIQGAPSRKTEPRWTERVNGRLEKHAQLGPFLRGCILQLLLSVVLRHQFHPALSVSLHKQLSVSLHKQLSRDAALHLRLHPLSLSHSRPAWSFPPL